MPITLSAKKKLKQDAKRQKHNIDAKRAVLDTIKKFKRNKSEKLLSEIFSVIDRAKKKNIFHANKAARMKSGLAKYMAATQKKVEKKVFKKKEEAPKKAAKKTTKKTAEKTSKK